MDVTVSRLSDSESLGKWLTEKAIKHEVDSNGNYYVSGLQITNLLKVKFAGTRKMYQYNLDGVKERILKEINK